MDFRKQETTTPSTTARRMMRDKTTKTTTLNFNDEHGDQCSNMGGGDANEISLSSTTTEDKKQKRLSGSGSGSTIGRRVATGGSCGGGGNGIVSCQAEKCTSDLTEAKRYHRRHKVCEVHAKAPYVLVYGLHQRFCQQCSRFHELPEFDDTKRSCRRRLAGHNERRRKSTSEPQAEGESSSQAKGSSSQFGPGCHERTTQISSFTNGNETSTYKQFQLR